MQNLTLRFFLDDCTAPEMRAQEAALADAHARAERAAHAARVHLGSVLSLNEAGFSADLTGCATRPDVHILMNGPRDDDPGSLGDVFVSVNATVTYAIVR